MVRVLMTLRDIPFPLSTYTKFLLKAYQTELELNMEFQGLLTHIH